MADDRVGLRKCASGRRATTGQEPGADRVVSAGFSVAVLAGAEGSGEGMGKVNENGRS